tara:strand:- start:165 stop:332 length:168 start_codon:yes stop_codon:yes gene_type:complete
VGRTIIRYFELTSRGPVLLTTLAGTVLMALLVFPSLPLNGNPITTSCPDTPLSRH